MSDDDLHYEQDEIGDNFWRVRVRKIIGGRRLTCALYFFPCAPPLSFRDFMVRVARANLARWEAQDFNGTGYDGADATQKQVQARPIFD